MNQQMNMVRHSIDGENLTTKLFRLRNHHGKEPFLDLRK